MQHQAVALQRLEGERDFITTRLDRVGRQVVAEVLRALEGCDILLTGWQGKGGREKNEKVLDCN